MRKYYFYLFRKEHISIQINQEYQRCKHYYDIILAKNKDFW